MKKYSELIAVFSVIILMVSLFVFAISSLNKPVTTQDVRQYIDYDAQIVCYILENGNGISCLPLSEVNISE